MRTTPPSPRGRLGVLALVLAVLALLGACATAPAAPASAPANATRHPRTTSATTASAGATQPPDAVVPASAPAARSVVALGDSIPAGSVCGCTPYPALYAQWLGEQTGRPVGVDNLAVGGIVTTDVLGQLTRPAVQTAVERASDVIVQIGANDFNDPRNEWAKGACTASVAECFQPTADRVRTNLLSIIQQVQDLSPDATVVVLDYWDVYEDGAVAREDDPGFVTTGHEVTTLGDAAIASAAEEAGVTLVPTLAAFKGPSGTGDPTHLLAGDGDHPNATGHELLATLVERVDGVR